MSRDGYRGPKLPKVLLNQVQSETGSKGHFVSRRDRHNTGRQEQKLHRSRASAEHNARIKHARPAYRQEADDDESDAGEPISTKSIPTRKEATSLKSILKKTPATVAPDLEDASDGSDEGSEHSTPTVSSGVKRKLVEDDAEIAALEKKLGIKGKKSKSLETDGLSWLIDGSDDESEDGFGTASKRKRKRPEDADWLRDKRLKATANASAKPPSSGATGSDMSLSSESDLDEEDESEGEDEEVDFEHGDEGSDDFAGFESEDSDKSVSDTDEAKLTARRPRENPYVAPVSKTTTKYVPPSLRKPATSEAESLRQLRRQLQGLLNRLSEANMLSILKSIEEIYSNHPRQHATSTIVDLLIGLVADSSTLNDTFLILHSGFTTALYKCIGTDFGAHLLEQVVETLDHHRDRKTNGKQSLNLLAFLSNLYTFQLVGSSLIFDYIRLLLQELSEDNTELLLRVIRTSGQQLRSDDPSSLKDIVLLLQRSVAAVGEETLSVRTKFMMETINDLKNNRMKTGVATSAMVAEHTSRMKKILSSLSTSRSIRASEPLRITLSDIRDSEKRGKWWLVGASYLDPNKHQQDAATRSKIPDNEDAGYESETPGTVNLQRLARNQGMNTDVRRAIFTTTLSSSDYKEAHLRLLKLHLKPKQQLEISRVLVHCVGIEEAYNPFYALVARQFCSEHKLRKAFQFTLWDGFQEMDGSGEDDEGDSMPMPKVLNLAKFYASLVANQALDIRVLKKLHLASLLAQQSIFVEMFLTTIFVLARKNRSAEIGQEELVKGIFARTAGLNGLLQGLLFFVEEVVSKADFAKGKSEQKAVRFGCEAAVEALREAASKTTVEASEDEED